MKRFILLVVAVFGFSTLAGCGYNTMQANEEAVFAAWGDVEASYQRRADLIPNLVEVVKGYAKHEAETLKAVTEARAKVGSVQVTKEMLNNPQAFDKFQQAQGQLSGALSRLMVMVEKYPDLKILTLSSFGDEKYYYKMVEAGVKGFVLKNSGISELEQAIKEVAAGGSWFSNELLQKVIVNIGKTSSKETEFSDREIEVLKSICDGLTNDQIAEKIHLSPDTVKWHRNNLLSKTGCNNTAALVLFAIKSKLIEI